MSGDVRLLREDDEVNDWLRDVYVADEAPFVELLRAHPLTRSLRDLPPEVTTQVAAQMIDSDIVVVGQLVRNKILVPTSGARPLLFPREQIERFVAAYVSTPELKRALGISSAGRFASQTASRSIGPASVFIGATPSKPHSMSVRWLVGRYPISGISSGRM